MVKSVCKRTQFLIGSMGVEAGVIFRFKRKANSLHVAVGTQASSA